MHWYYSVNSERRGPIPAGDLASMIDKGSLPADSLAWRDGLPDWVPVHSIRAQLQTSGNPSPVTVAAAPATGGKIQRCAECGYLIPQAEMLTMEGKCVCARCKPLFLQKLREGVPLGGTNGIWRRGREMVVALEAPLPERCVKCNAGATGKRLKRPMYWHHPALYIMVLFPGLLIYALVAVCVRKTATVYVGLCDSHRSKRRNAMLIAWTAFLLGLGSFFAAGAFFHGDTSAWVILSGFVLVIGAAIYGVYATRIVYPKKIDKTHAYVCGVCPDFLSQLPDWPND